MTGAENPFYYDRTTVIGDELVSNKPNLSRRLSRFEKNLASVTVGLNRDDGEKFNELAMMCEMGFFIRTGERYQMVIPTDLTWKQSNERC